MRRICCTTLAVMLCLSLGAPARTGEKTKAITPFNGKDLTGWKLRGKEEKNKWAVGAASVDEKGKLVYNKDGHQLVNTAGGGIDIYTEQVFADCRVEVEVMVPKGSNSGIYLMGRYEVQVLDSFGVKTLGTGDMGAIYSVAAPKVNACKKPGEWQKFVIDFQAPRFDGKILQCLYGSYTEIQHFPYATLVRLSWRFDKDGKLTSIAVSRTVDGP